MKWTIKSLRAEIDRVLSKQLIAVHLSPTSPNSCAKCEYTEDGIEIWIDCYYADILQSVVHEILHKTFDRYFTEFATYHVYEYWITSLERPILKGLPRKIQRRWIRLIKRKIR